MPNRAAGPSPKARRTSPSLATVKASSTSAAALRDAIPGRRGAAACSEQGERATRRRGVCAFMPARHRRFLPVCQARCRPVWWSASTKRAAGRWPGRWSRRPACWARTRRCGLDDSKKLSAQAPRGARTADQGELPLGAGRGRGRGDRPDQHLRRDHAGDDPGGGGAVRAGRAGRGADRRQHDPAGPGARNGAGRPARLSAAMRSSRASPPPRSSPRNTATG